MTGYRVAVDAPDDPLEVDEALCQQQFFRQRLGFQIALAILTVGLWLPVLVVWLLLASDRMRRRAEGYRVRVQGGTLAVGNAHELRSVPLDAITGVSVQQGFVTVTVRGGTPLSVFGLRDPVAASSAILEARDAHVRALRPEAHEELVEAEAPSTRARR